MDDTQEIARLKEDLRRAEELLTALRSRLDVLEKRPGSQAINPSAPEQAVKVEPRPAAPLAVPPVIRPAAPSRPVAEIVPATTPRPAPQAPPVVQAAPSLARHKLPHVEEPTPGGVPAPPKGSLEMQVGTYWLVRIGIVLLLTGLVFLGNYAYKNWIGHLGPLGKLILLYLGSGALLAVGWWLQRKREEMRNYAQILFAGGLAAVYFTTYAAHYIEPLRVIANPYLAGVCLFAWAGFMVFLAERKRSEILALFGVGLAYYTSIISEVRVFTLFSNLVLTVAAVVFLVRHRWVKLSVASLFATYGAYFYWRFLFGNQWHGPAVEGESLWVALLFLSCYWALFTSAVFLLKADEERPLSRAWFASGNNGAFFVLATFTLPHLYHGRFWILPLSLGTALVILHVLTLRVLPGEKRLAEAYLIQGLLLVTLGFLSWFSGLKLALVLAVEGAMLGVLGQQWRHRLLRWAGMTVAALAAGQTLLQLAHTDQAGYWTGGSVGLLMFFSAWWNRDPEGERWTATRAAYYTLLGLAVWFFTTWEMAPGRYVAPVLVGEALLLVALGVPLGLPEAALFGQILLLFGQADCLVRLFSKQADIPWWNPVVVVAGSLALSYWWQRQKAEDWPHRCGDFTLGLLALALVGVLFGWLQPLFAGPEWLLVSGGLAMAVAAYGTFTRLWTLAVFGQMFCLVCVVEFARQLFFRSESSGLPPGGYAFGPVVVLLIMARLGAKAWGRCGLESADPVPLEARVAQIYNAMATLLALAWVVKYVPARQHVWVMILTGAVLFSGGGWRSSPNLLWAGVAFMLAGAARFFLIGGPLNWIDPAAFVVVLIVERRAKSFSAPFPGKVRAAMVLVAATAIWVFVSRWVSEQARGFYLTVAWAVLALGIFGAGFFLRDRIYRWFGLGILACALGRVVLFDVWKLETPYRILSFLGLGVVLLVLGFVYNRFQEKIKQWL